MGIIVAVIVALIGGFVQSGDIRTASQSTSTWSGGWPSLPPGRCSGPAT